jgi:hypothetical protein
MSELESINVETPLDLRPNLADYGIEEYDSGICEDSAENRATLRANKLSWRAVLSPTGETTNLIEAYSRAMQVSKNAHFFESRRTLLEDPRDENSDYLTGLDLILTDDVSAMVPPWVLAATRTHEDLLRRKEANPNKVYKTQYQNPPARCRIIKADGLRCLSWSAGRVDEEDVCRTHLLSKQTTNTSVAIETARRRVMQSAPKAVDVLEGLLDVDSEPMRLKAATELLDRAGIRGGVEVEQKVTLEVKPSAAQIREKLKQLSAAQRPHEAGNIESTVAEPGTDTVTVDAEVVE